MGDVKTVETLVHGRRSRKGVLGHLKKAAMEVLRTADHSGSVLHAAKHQKLLNAREMWAIINELLTVMREVASNTNDMKRSLDNMEGM